MRPICRQHIGLPSSLKRPRTHTNTHSDDVETHSGYYITHTHRSMCAHKALFPLDSLFVLVVQQQRGQSLNCTMATKQVTSTLYKL